MIWWPGVGLGAAVIVAGLMIHVYRQSVTGYFARRNRETFGRFGERAARTNPLAFGIVGLGIAAIGALVILLSFLLLILNKQAGTAQVV
jgi:hypothetical protein